MRNPRKPDSSKPSPAAHTGDMQLWTIVTLCSIVITSIALSACAPNRKTGNDWLFEEFDLIPAPEQRLLDAAYVSLQELYPYSLIMPISGPGIGYTVDVDHSLDYPLFPILPVPSFYRQHIEISFTLSLGRTPNGSIITGPKVNAARKLQPEDHRHDVHPSTPFTRSGTGGTVPSTFATGYRYATVSYLLTSVSTSPRYYDSGGYINDLIDLHDFDIIFRSELFKRRIEPVSVTRVM